MIFLQNSKKRGPSKWCSRLSKTTFSEKYDCPKNNKIFKKIEQMAKANGADHLITTEKDLIKLSGFKFNIPLYAVKIRLEFHPKSKLEHYLQPFL